MVPPCASCECKDVVSCAISDSSGHTGPAISQLSTGLYSGTLDPTGLTCLGIWRKGRAQHAARAKHPSANELENMLNPKGGIAQAWGEGLPHLRHGTAACAPLPIRTQHIQDGTARATVNAGPTFRTRVRVGQSCCWAHPSRGPWSGM